MTKEYWGKGTGFLTPREPEEDAPATARVSHAPTARSPETKRPKFVLPKLPQATSRGTNPLALDELKLKPRTQVEAPSYFDGRNEKRSVLPNLVRTVDFGRRLWFAVAFVAPLVIGFIYLFVIAPDQYVTEFRFSVRVPIRANANNNSAGSGSFAALFGGNTPPTLDTLDNYTVTDYVSSAQAARDLDAKVNLRAIFNKPSDPLSKLGEHPTAERLGRYWRKMVYANFDPATGLAVVRVNAYTAADSFAIATNLMTMSAEVVNAQGTQSQRDSVRFAQEQLDRSNAQVVKLRGELADLRRQSNFVDPQKGAVAGNIDLINQLVDRRSQMQAQLDVLRHQLGNSEAPQVQLLQQQIAGLSQQINEARKSGGATAGGPNIAVTIGSFETLSAQLTAALSVEAAATQALSDERTGADSQRIYLAPYVRPSLPEAPLGPNRWIDMLLILGASAMVWVIGRMVGNSIMEHD